MVVADWTLTGKGRSAVRSGISVEQDRSDQTRSQREGDEQAERGGYQGEKDRERDHEDLDCRIQRSGGGKHEHSDNEHYD